MNKADKNIENIQIQVENSINELLVKNGYSLIDKEKSDDFQALMLQWATNDRRHGFELIWDIRELWFSLLEFNQTNNQNYIESTEIALFPYSYGVLFRKRYDRKYVEKIKSKIEVRLSRLKP
ncbi:MAG: hypothetical protein V4613_02935 [Bacteroidota bacterium]